DRAGLILGRRLADDAATWRREGRDPAALYRGARLAAADGWAQGAGTRAAVPPPAREFLDASIELASAEQSAARRRMRRLRVLVACLSALLVTAAVAAVAAVRNGQAAQQQRDNALSRQVAGEVAGLRDTNPALAAQLGLAAYRLAPTVDARGSVLSTFGRP